MKEFLNIVKHNTLFGIIIGIVICSLTFVIAESINSNEVLYDNSNSSSNSDNVQDVLDHMYRLIGHSSLGYQLLARVPSGLSTELVAGLYRYQGTTANNYICFNTTDKDNCTSDTDKYMYRIVGINESGQMKLIKKEALNTTYAWNSTSDDTAWNNSSLFAGLNGNYFLDNTNYISNDWKNKIVMSEWHHGLVTSVDYSASDMANIELAFPTVSAKIGLLYVHDYDYGLVGGNNCHSNYSLCKSSWIYLWQNQNDSNSPNSTYEWIIMRYGSGTYGYRGWFMYSDGSVWFGNQSYHGVITETMAVRPVFFLRASERIASGNGTITDPYILS